MLIRVNKLILNVDDYQMNLNNVLKLLCKFRPNRRPLRHLHYVTNCNHQHVVNTLSINFLLLWNVKVTVVITELYEQQM
jgi:hypothetical protein